MVAPGIRPRLFPAPPRVADFLIGVAIFMIALNCPEGNYRSLPIFALGAALSASLMIHPVDAICSAFVLLLLPTERQWPSLFNARNALTIGDASYSIYRIQVFTISVSLKLAKLFSDRLPAGYGGFTSFYGAALLIGFFSTVLAGISMRRMVEKPSFQWLMAPRFRP